MSEPWEMTYRQAVAVLDQWRGQPAEIQQLHTAAIEEAFTVFWAHRPDEDFFATHASHLILTARMLYIMQAGCRHCDHRAREHG